MNRELPEPAFVEKDFNVSFYSKAQVLAIQKQAYEDGLRDAAKLCADYAASLHDGINGRDFALFEASRRIIAMLTASQKRDE